MTTNDDNVWALDATTGKVKWRWTPDDVAVFRNFGIVANRGVALCDGHVFVLTLDMTIVSLDPATGQLQRQVPIARGRPGRVVRTTATRRRAPRSAPTTALIVGAAGSEYGVRGFVMAYHTDLTPAWPNPFWTIPPAGTSWRQVRDARRRRRRLDADDRRPDDEHALLRHRLGDAALLPVRSGPAPNPRADSLIAVESRHRDA